MAGIYKITNKYNGKCYIGQSVNIKTRLRDHFRKANKVQSPLYSAIRKYGKSAFDIEILETVEFGNGVKQILDELEKRYISKYDSYKTGYNQTIGGDAGVLGYKFTEEQRKHVSENVRKRIELGNLGKKVYAYNLQTKEIKTSNTIGQMAEMIGISRSVCSRMIKNKKINKSWFISENKDVLSQLPEAEASCDHKFKVKYICEFYYKDKQFIGTIKDAAVYFGVRSSYLYAIVNGSRKSNSVKYKIIDNGTKI